MKIQSVSKLAEMVATDQALSDRLKENPANTLAAIAAPLQTDVVIYRVVVISLGGAVLLGIIGAVVLSAIGKPIPEMLTALGSAAVGALAGLLAPSPVNQ